MLHFLMNEKDHPLVHASCVSKDGYAFLFTSRGGAGKTKTALRLVEKGFGFLGDNYIALHEGHALSFLGPLDLFSYNVSSEVKTRLRIKDRLLLKSRELLYDISLGYAKFFTKINVKDVFSTSIVKGSKLHSVYVLLPGKRFRVRSAEKAETARRMVINQKMEFPSFLRYLLAYSYIFPKSNFATHWESYSKNLLSSLGDPKCYLVELPRTCGTETLEEIESMIMLADQP